MKKIMTAVMFLITALAFTACSYTPIENGVIKDKSSYTQVIYHKVGDVPVPQYNTYYDFKVEYTDAETGALKTDTWSVSYSSYNSCEVGNRIDRAEDGSLTCSLR